MLVKWYNRFLDEGIMQLKRFKMVLIPKHEKAEHPKDFRPLSIGSMVRRVFSGILNRKISQIKTDSPQRGFKAGIEGCNINLRILSDAAKMAIKKERDMSVAWIDLKKAFDSVNHLKLVEVLNSTGIPRKITRMITNMYRGNSSYLRTGERIAIERGVLQGDPMSPTLFNLVLNEALRGLAGGIQYGESKLNYLAFADDIVVLANSPKELQEQLTNLYKRLKAFGLEINPDKCKCAHIQTCKKLHTYFIAVKPEITINNSKIPNLNSDETYKYLGIEVKANGVRKCKTEWDVELERIGKSYLKSYQKMEVLRTHLIPKILYGTTHSHIKRTAMKSLDQRIRKWVRVWLHLPKDYPSSMIHSASIQGGLGIKRVADTTITRRNDILKRLKDMRYTKDRDVQVLLQSMKEDTTTLNDDSEDMYNTRDGKGLRSHGNGSGYKSSWIRDPPNNMKGKDWNELIRTRAAVLENPARLARMNKEEVPMCANGCANKKTKAIYRDTLNHLMSRCDISKEMRRIRHDRIMDKLAEQLRKNNYEVILEPLIPSKPSDKKPDIVAYHREKHKVLVWDPTVTGDLRDLDEAEYKKREKYDVEDVHKWLNEKFPSGSKYGSRRLTIEVSGIALNWRGAWSEYSYEALREEGLTKKFIELLSMIVLEESHKIWRVCYRDNK